MDRTQFHIKQATADVISAFRCPVPVSPERVSGTFTSSSPSYSGYSLEDDERLHSAFLPRPHGPSSALFAASLATRSDHNRYQAV